MALRIQNGDPDAGWIRFQIRLLLAIATAVALGEFVKRRHLRVELPALDEQEPARLSLVSRRLAPCGLAIGLVAVARPAITGLAVALLLVEPHAVGDIGRTELRSLP